MREETLILVDENDNFLGYASRDECHRGRGKRHRAFVTLLVDSQNRVILQKRKHRLFDNLWDLTAVSHPLHLSKVSKSQRVKKSKSWNEPYQQASDRTLKRETGIGHVPIKKVGAFNYFARHGQNCENECCAILIGKYDGQYKPNPAEVYEIKKMNFDEFVKDVKKNPKKYTPWTRLAVGQLAKKNSKTILLSSPSIGVEDKLRRGSGFPIRSGMTEDESLEQFKREMEQFLEFFEPYAKNYFEKKIKEVQKYPKIIGQFWQDLADFTSGGKKMRAFLVYLGSQVASNVKDSPLHMRRILPVSLAFEIVHSFLLIHDDIIDQSDTRRGQPTIHKRYSKLFGSHYGISQAIILGDLACLEALDLINDSDFEPSLKNLCFSHFLRILTETVYGQGLDVEYAYREATLSEIRQVTDLKTARYSFVGPLTIGAILGRSNQSHLKALTDFGLAVGTAFQLHDDVLGVFGDEKVLGKSTLSDLREGKNTVLIYKTRELANSKQRRRIAQLWGKRDGNVGDIEEIREIIKSSGALGWCKIEESRLITEAKRFVKIITKDSRLKAIFEQMADFVVSRNV